MAVVQILVGTSAAFGAVTSLMSACAAVSATAHVTSATCMSFYTFTTIGEGIGPLVALGRSFFHIVVVFHHEKMPSNVIDD